MAYNLGKTYRFTPDELLAAYAEGKRNFEGADLPRGANFSRANLARANLTGADLSGAYLSGANLTGANLTGADLTGANLSLANLTGANLGGQWVIQGSIRSDGYSFMLSHLTNEPVLVKAGCRSLEPAAAVKHWTETRGGTPLGDESLAIVAQLLDLQRIRGLV